MERESFVRRGILICIDIVSLLVSRAVSALCDDGQGTRVRIVLGNEWEA
jgi:hypothetical protein